MGESVRIAFGVVWDDLSSELQAEQTPVFYNGTRASLPNLCPRRGCCYPRQQANLPSSEGSLFLKRPSEQKGAASVPADTKKHLSRGAVVSSGWGILVGQVKWEPGMRTMSGRRAWKVPPSHPQGVHSTAPPRGGIGAIGFVVRPHVCLLSLA